MSNLERLLDRINVISEWSGEALKWLLIPLTGIVFGEVLLRYIFNAPTIWSYELTEYLFGFLSLMGGAYCMRLDIHVRMDFMRDRVSPRRKAILDVSTSLITIFYLGVLLMEGWIYVWPAVLTLETSGTVWDPPYWPYALALPIAVTLLLIQLSGNLMASIKKIINNGDNK